MISKGTAWWEIILVLYYKDRKYAMNENSSLCIAASVHYNASDLIII